jgi:hypothetical protein
LGAFLVVFLVLRGCFDGCRNKGVEEYKEVLFEGQRRGKLGKFMKKISDVWCS